MSNFLGDFIVLVVVAVCIILGYKTGLIKTIFRPHKVYALIVAYCNMDTYGAHLSDKYIFPFVYGKIRGSIDGVIPDLPNAADVTEQLPSFFRTVLDLCNVDVDSIVGEAIAGGNNLIDSIANKVSEFISGVLAGISAFIILYAIVNISLIIIGFVLDKVFKDVAFNRIGGVVFGVISAFLFAGITAIVIKYGFSALGSNTNSTFFASFDPQKTLLVRFFSWSSPINWFS